MTSNAFARQNAAKLLWAPRYLLGDLVTRVVPRRRERWVVGSAFGVHDGARALVEELVARGRGRDVTWLARSEAEEEDARRLGVRVARHGSGAAFRAAVRAGVVVLTHGFGDASRFGTRGALVVQLWHGSPLKRMHLDSPAAMRLPVLGDRGPVPGLLAQAYRRGGARIGLLPVASSTVRPFMASALGVDPSRVEVLGEPRTDVLHRGSAGDRRAAARRRLEEAVGPLGDRTVVLLAPTWRDGAGDPVVPTAAEWTALDAWLEARDAVLLVRPHPLAVGDWSHEGERVRLLGSAVEPDVIRVLWGVDAVVSDYSSIVVDAAVTGSPLVFLAPDEAEYTARHGLYLPYAQTTGGSVQRSWAEALERLDAVLPGGSAADEAAAHAAGLAARYHEVTDGRAAERVVDRVDELLGAAAGRPQRVFFESFHGRTVACNPAALDREIATRFPTATRTWSVSRDGVEVPDGATGVRVGTPEWLAARDAADLLVLNDWIEDDWRPRRDQFVLQTWHGTPLKRIALGRRGRTPRLVAAVVKQSTRWSAMLAQNPFGARALRRSYAVAKPMWTLGYPRNDVLVTGADPGLRNRLGVTTPKVVLYAPTWRDDALEGPDPLDAVDLARRLGPDWTVLVRGHARTLDRRRAVDGERVLDVSAHPDVSDLMAVSDVLVTDYSSVMFDFSATGRPLVFYVADEERYASEVRGFAWDLRATAPGPLVRTVQECADAVARAHDPAERDRWSARYRAWRAEFNPLDDGHASERVVDRLVEVGALRP
ncbi:CDP-glycerol glycerophosphotransferase family protein [Oryzobacter sp. R7]|uniref:CDP-glycerol glycerophosphotransferase family protein n=1 Tax=Oryzobacter faecalis TaxID=3388656 RepID=UPI00398CDA80